ncbi:MAG: hypothetical protein CVT64_07835 [Actinobacteria bacterium HGW-Actinobacteria-4]|nr:MAG: hypothetical protein CVT64_07835 [Actinobacteria bacterium HGW-Actinobacteria-4]
MTPGTGPQATATSRAWVATALMVALFAMLFIPSLLLIDVFHDSTRVFQNITYALVALIAFAVTVVVLIPVGAHTLGRYIDARTREGSDLRAALIFAGVAAGIGSVMAVPFTLSGSVGVLPLLTYMLVPGLAAFGTRMLLPVALRVKAVRAVAIVAAVAVGVVLATMAVWNVVQNIA